MTHDVADDGVQDRPSALRKRAVGAVLALAVIAAIYGFVLPSIASYDDVWDTLGEMSRVETTGLVALAGFNLWTYLPLLTSVLPGLRQRQAFVVNNSSTAVSNTMPGGGALGVAVTYTMYRSWGFSNQAIGLSVVASGIWNNFVKLGLPIVALALLAIAGEAEASLVAASFVGVLILAGAVLGFGLILRSEHLAQRLGERAALIVAPVLRLGRRAAPTGWGPRAVEFRESVIDLVTDRWLRITTATVVSHITLFFVLLIAVRNVGISNAQVSWAAVLAAFAFGRLVSAIPVTPGGLGVIELGYVAALSVGVGSAVETRIVTAVLLFRAVTFIPPIAIGGFTYLFWKRNNTWRRPVNDSVPAVTDLGVPA